MEKKGIGIIIFLFCFLVFSCKKVENKIDQGIVEVPEIEQDIQELLEMSKLVRDEDEYYIFCSYELLGGSAKAWKIYENINAKYSSETIEEEYFKTDPSVAKIYLYWILRERNWHNVSQIHEDLLKRESEVIFCYDGGCVPYRIPLRNIIEWPFKEGDIYVDGIWWYGSFVEKVDKEVDTVTTWKGTGYKPRR